MVQLNKAPAAGAKVQIIRETPRVTRLVQYFGGGILKAADLNLAQLQILYVVQEITDVAAELKETWGEHTQAFDRYLEHMEVLEEHIASVVNDALSSLQEATGMLSAMQEFRFSGPWVPNKTYKYQNVVEYMGSTYVLKAVGGGGKTPPPGGDWQLLTKGYDTNIEFIHAGAWSADKTYKYQNVVQHKGSSYVLTSVSGGGRTEPPGGDWKLLAQGYDENINFYYAGTWTAGKTYKYQNVVEYKGSTYALTSVNGGGTSAPPGAGWELMTKGFDPSAIPATPVHRLRQIDLALPYEFGATATKCLLRVVAQDSCRWFLEPARIVKVYVKWDNDYLDTGTSPTIGITIGTSNTLTTATSGLSSLTNGSETTFESGKGFLINTGHWIELHVMSTKSGQNTHKNLRVSIVAEVV